MPSNAELISQLEALGYRINREMRTIEPPATPRRQTLALSESYEDYGRSASGLNQWLPGKMKGDRSGNSMRRIADRAIPWSQAAGDCSPDEVVAAAAAMLTVAIMGPRELAKLPPDTEI